MPRDRSPRAFVLSPRFTITAVVGTVLAALMTGIPTELIPNPWFTRMTPVRPLDVVFWVILSPLTGVLLATYFAGGRPRAGRQGAATGVLSVFAIGCPICNKLVVVLLGTSGALTYFAPIQPLLGVGAVALAAWALRMRMREMRAGCALPGAVQG